MGKEPENTFRIEMNKIPSSRSGSVNVLCASKRQFFDMMMFVKDIVFPSTSSGNLLHSAPSLWG
jgi:hypothetical protein